MSQRARNSTNSCLCLETTVLWLRAMISAGSRRDSSQQALVAYDCIWLKEACATEALLRPGPATAVSTGSPNFTLFSEGDLAILTY